MSLQSKLVFYGIFAILAIGGGLYYYSAVQKRTDTSETPQLLAAATATPVATGNGMGAQVQLVQEPPQGGETAAFPMPNLNRPVAARIPLSAFAEADARKNISGLSERLRKNSDDFSAWLFLGVYRKTLGDYEGAEEVWLYVAKRWPTDYVAYNNLGNLYHAELHDFPKAEEYFLKATSIRPDFIQTYVNLYDLYRYSYKGQEAKAPGALLQGLLKNPTNLNLMLALARYYAESGNKNSASMYYKMAIQRAETEEKMVLAESLRKEAKEAEIEI